MTEPLASCDRTIAAPVDLVWSLISTAEGLREWMAVDATVELRVGGSIRWVHENGWIVSGTIKEVAPMRRLSYTYGWERGGFDVPLESSVVTIELTGRGAVTDLSVRHTGLTAEMAEQHTGGWEWYIGSLECAAVPAVRTVRTERSST